MAWIGRRGQQGRSIPCVYFPPFSFSFTVVHTLAEASASNLVPASAGAAVQRRFGHFVLKRPLGRSSASMAWLADDLRSRSESLLMLPRRPREADAEGLRRALDLARHAARVDHPRVQAATEVGQFGGWVFVASALRQGVQTLQDWLALRQEPPKPPEAVGWCVDALEGLAAAHDAGVAHGDIGLHSLLVDRQGRVRPWGFAIVDTHTGTGAGIDVAQVQQRRSVAARDVLAIGCLLESLLNGAAGVGTFDVPAALRRLEQGLPPQSSTATPPPTAAAVVPEGLRPILARALSPAAQRRYPDARSLARALDGWRQGSGEGRASAPAVMLARIRTVGHLPALPGLASRVAKLVRMEARPLAELIDTVLDDPALALELLRLLNSAAHRRAEPVGSMHRAMLLLGLQGVRRSAGSLRAWPGLLGPDQASRLERSIHVGRQAARVAVWLAPPGLPADEVKLAVLLQQLGRLLVACHFPDAAGQIDQLMRPAITRQGDARQVLPGLDEATAARSVLGVELPALTHALLRHWGVGSELEQLAWPLERDQIVRTPERASGWLRTVASCAHEAMDIWLARRPHGTQAFEPLAARYARVLDLTAVDVRAAVERSALPLAHPAVQETACPVEPTPRDTQ